MALGFKSNTNLFESVLKLYEYCHLLMGIVIELIAPVNKHQPEVI